MPGIAVGNKLGNGFRFKSATNRTVTFTSSALNFLPGSSSFTISITAYLVPGVVNGTLISNGGNSGQGWYIDIGPLGCFCSFWNGTSVNSISIPIDFLGSIITIVWSYTPTAQFLKVNNHIVKATMSAFSGSYSPVNQFYIGGWRPNASAGTYLLESIVYNLIILNRAVTESEANKIVNKDGLQNFISTDYIGLYRFEQKTGTTIVKSDGFLPNFTVFGAANTSLGSSNQWVDKFQSPILI